MKTDDQPPGKWPTETADQFVDMVRELTDLPAAKQVPDELRALPGYAGFKELGRGGMGVVFLARNTLLDRLEVLKVAQVRTGRGRFLREMQSVAKLQHPNVVTAYSASVQGAVLVFAMEYVPGEDLQKLITRKGQLAVPAACFYAYCAAQGLQHAHDHGLVHRDIKPANLLLTKVRDKAVVKVADFGLAKAHREADGHGPTEVGQAAGTPAYMAPEQWLNVAGVDIRADIYSLGCTLYCLLTGHPPFRGNPDVQRWAHTHTPAPPVREARPDIPEELAAVVAKMLAKRLEDRYATPGEVAAAVRGFVKTPSKPDDERPQPQPAEPTAATRPGGLLWAAVTAALLAVGGGAWLATRTPTPATGPTTPPTANGGTVVMEGVPAGAEVRAADGQEVRAEPLPPPSDGFGSLFNGKDLGSWEVDFGRPRQWTVENEAIVSRSPGPDARTYLLSRRDYSDFVFRFEYNMDPGGHGGVILRAMAGEHLRAKKGIVYAGHPHIAIKDPAERATGSTFWVETERSGVRPQPLPAQPPNGQWVRVEVTVRGDTCTATFDGVGFVDLKLSDRSFKGATPALGRKSGRVGFLSHNGTRRLQLRNIEIRELPLRRSQGA